MALRCIIVHGWGGHPAEGWFPWLGRELASRGFAVAVPQLPNPDVPRIEQWVPALATAIGQVDADTYLIGHSLGCQTIARYLATLPVGVTVGGVVYVAGFFRRLTGLEDDDETKATAQHWLTAPLNLSAVRSRAPHSVAIFSDNDPYVPLDNQDDFAQHLGSKVVVVPTGGHFSGGDDGTLELPQALAAVLRLARLPE